jgi:pyruvate dehydrogenase E1 component
VTLVDSNVLLYYKEAKDGQILEEGITEAGSMSSFIAAGTAYATHGVNTIPFFIYYSMFGFQRIGDLIWAAADSRTRGFMLGGTAGRTTLAGEGLQHQDGNSHLFAMVYPNCVAYDPAFAYEIAVIIEDGIRRMYVDQESIFYYLTVMNEQYAMPEMPAGSKDGILKGMYKFRAASQPKAPLRAQLFGSGAILPEVIKAQEILESKYNVFADVWSVTSYTELYRDGHAAERWNMLHPAGVRRVPYVTQCLKDAEGVLIAALVGTEQDVRGGHPHRISVAIALINLHKFFAISNRVSDTLDYLIIGQDEGTTAGDPMGRIVVNGEEHLPRDIRLVIPDHVVDGVGARRLRNTNA